MSFKTLSAFILCARVIHLQMISLLQGLKKPLPVVVVCIFRHVLGTCILGYLMAFPLGMEELRVWWSWFIVAWSAAIIIYLHGKKCSIKPSPRHRIQHHHDALGPVIPLHAYATYFEWT